MARKKETEDIIETKVEEVAITPEEQSDESFKRLEEEAKLVKEKQKTQTKLYLKTDTPYVTTPTVAVTSIGILKAGSVLYVEDEITNEEGEFWKIDNKTYINKVWDVEVFI